MSWHGASRLLAALVAVLGVPGAASAATPAHDAARAAAPAQAREVLLVGRRGGLPASEVRRLRRERAVQALTEVSRTQWLLRRSRTAEGRVVDAPARGYAIPLDTFVVDRRAYARVVGGDGLAGLRAGHVLLSRSSARVRRLGVGDQMTLTGGRTVRIAGIVADHVGRGAEVIAAAADVPRARRHATAVVLATRDRAAVARAVSDGGRTIVGPLDARPDSATTAGSVTHAAELKRRFGEFAVRLPYGVDWIDIDPGWVRREIVTRTVPILGAVTCHRAMIAPLRRALGSLQRQGLARLVDRGDYAGCFAARRIPGSGSLSLHAWGLAADINASRNPQGSRPKQDPRLVRAFVRAGFSWGGRWPTAPDGMHFEWHGGAPAGGAASTGAAGPPVRITEERVAPHAVFFDRRPVSISFRYAGPADQELDVEVVGERTGRVARRLVIRRAEPGPQRLTFDGVAGTGRPVGDGRYRVRLVVPALGRRRLLGRFTLHGRMYPIRGPHADRGPIGTFGAPRNGGRTHEGYDVDAACGTRLVAARGGTVVRSRYDPVLYGNEVIIRGRLDGRTYRYAHMRSTPLVRRGERVRTGEHIGDVGDTGNARTVGCHLHFELRDHRGRLLDPAGYLHAWDRVS